jgi:hypothetical protein
MRGARGEIPRQVLEDLVTFVPTPGQSQYL